MTIPTISPIPPGRYNGLPFPIAACCAHFNNFVARGEIVAAWLEARDVYEVVTKFSVAALAAEEFALGGHSPVAATLTARLLAKNPSFGDWVDALRDVAARGGDLPADTQRIVAPILYDVVFLRSTKRRAKPGPAMGILRKAVTWRNDEIGHGALGRKSDYLRGTVADQANLLSELLECVKPLSGLRLVARLNGGEIDLTGATLPQELAASRQCSGSAPEIYLYRQADRYSVRLHPLVLLERASTGEPGVLIFDKRVLSREGRPKADVYLDYEAGTKTVMASVPTRGLVESIDATSLALDGKETRLAETLKADRTSYSASLHERVQRLRLGLDDAHRFVTPREAIAGLRAWLDSVPLGYLHVIGPAGVGKSWLAGNLQRADVLGEDHAGSVLTFHVGFGSAQSQAVFVSELNSQALRRFDRMQAVLAEEHTPAAARERLSRFLSDLAASSPSGEVILVVDGVDEVVDAPDRDVSILDFLPDVETLADGVHIVLFSRPIAEVGETGRRSVNRLRASAASESEAWQELPIDPASGQQQQLVEKLIGDRLSGEAVELRKRVEELSSGIPLRAAHLCTLVKMSDGEALEHVGGSLAALYATYLERMQQRIGATWFNRLYRPLISVLAVAREPLDLEGLAEVLDVSAEHIFLASLDLSDCLRTRRYAGEATVFLEVSHFELRQFVRDQPEMWEEGHAKLGRCFLRWWRDEWLTQPDRRIEQYAACYLPVHLVGAQDGDGLSEVLSRSLQGDATLGLDYLRVVLDGLRGHERLVAMETVRHRLAFLADVLGRVQETLREEDALGDEVSDRMYGLRIQVVASLADRYAHTAPERALEFLGRAVELANAAAADLRGDGQRAIETERAVLSYKLHENLRSAGRSVEAKQALRDSLKLREELAASAVSVQERRSQLNAVIWCHLGMATFGGTSEPEKVEHLGRAESVLREIGQLGAESPEVEDQVARLQAVVASSLAAVRPDDRAGLLEQAIAAYRRARQTSPEDRFLEYSLGSAERYLANARLERDEPEAALPHMIEAEKIVVDLLEYEPANVFYIRLDAHLRRLRSRLKLREGDTADAIERMRDACRRMEAAGAVLKSALAQREIDEFRTELESIDPLGKKPA